METGARCRILCFQLALLPPHPHHPHSGATAAVIVYDVTSPDSFARAQAWVRELQRQASPSLAIALAGNKSDLADADAGSSRAVPTSDARAYADDNGLRFWETSAKTGANVAAVFEDLAARVPRGGGAGGPGGSPTTPGAAPGGGITLAEPAPGRPARSACCS